MSSYTESFYQYRPLRYIVDKEGFVCIAHSATTADFVARPVMDSEGTLYLSRRRAMNRVSHRIDEKTFVKACYGDNIDTVKEGQPTSTPKRLPDADCLTTEDGGCEATKCMHTTTKIVLPVTHGFRRVNEFRSVIRSDDSSVHFVTKSRNSRPVVGWYTSPETGTVVSHLFFSSNLCHVFFDDVPRTDGKTKSGNAISVLYGDVGYQFKDWEIRFLRSTDELLLPDFQQHHFTVINDLSRAAVPQSGGSDSPIEFHRDYVRICAPRSEYQKPKPVSKYRSRCDELEQLEAAPPFRKTKTLGKKLVHKKIPASQVLMNTSTFIGVVWPDGGVTIRLRDDLQKHFVMTRGNSVDIPEEILENCSLVRAGD